MDLTGILIIAVLALMVILFLFDYRKNSPYNMVIARVKEVEVTDRHLKNGQPYKAYVPIYEYEVDGETYTARGALSMYADKHAVGDTRGIAVHKKDPNQIRLVKRNIKARSYGFLLAIIGLIIIVVGYFLLS